MTVTAAFRFPLGRYHATPWDRSVNEGAVEWPPSPWRLLRTLVATWYSRWPELPAPVLDQLLDHLGDPPSYRVPEAIGGHTRHYLPDASRSTGETGNTDLTLDPFLWISRDEPLLVRWEVDLGGEQRELLAKLLELIPYVGRAESVCDARLLCPDQVPDPDASWWRPGGSGATETVRLLAPTVPVQRAALELSTVEVRRRRRTLPERTRWVTYSRAAPAAGGPIARERPVDRIDTIRFAVESKAPLTSANGVLLADELHRIATSILDGGRAEVIGHHGAATDHQHAHWVPVAAGPEPGARVHSLVVWVPRGLAQEEVGAIIADRRLRTISGRRGGEYEVKGLPRLELLFQAAGGVETVGPELCGPARRWRSLTPYLPVRHRKPNRETPDEHLVHDVRKELDYRRRADPVSARRLSPEQGFSDRWSLGFRRYRMNERIDRARRGLGLRLEFQEPVTGPLLLGQLSHFGYGVFVPDET